MTTLEQIKQTPHGASVFKRMFQGAVLAFTLLFLFLMFIIIASDAEMGFWIFAPLSTVCIGGVAGGVFFYVMDFVRQFGSWQKVTANILCVPGFVIPSWLGMVYGFFLVGMWH